MHLFGAAFHRVGDGLGRGRSQVKMDLKKIVKYMSKDAVLMFKEHFYFVEG